MRKGETTSETIFAVARVLGFLFLLFLFFTWSLKISTNKCVAGVFDDFQKFSGKVTIQREGKVEMQVIIPSDCVTSAFIKESRNEIPFNVRCYGKGPFMAFKFKTGKRWIEFWKFWEAGGGAKCVSLGGGNFEVKLGNDDGYVLEPGKTYTLRSRVEERDGKKIKIITASKVG